MARYMIQASYNNQGVVDLVKNPQDRSVAIGPLIEGLGGKMHSFDYCFGEYDVLVIAELPDNVSMAALAMAISAGGAVGGLKTTVLLSMDEAVEAMRKAGSVAYRPPSS